jgi:hypothetical protein
VNRVDEQLSLVARYSSGQIELSGTSRAIAYLAQVLYKRSVATYRLQVPVNEPIEPYDVFLSFLTIIQDTDPLHRITVRVDHQESLIIEGPSKSLELLAANLEWFATTKPPDAVESLAHLHIDYYPDHPFLEPSSSELIVGLRDG